MILTEKNIGTVKSANPLFDEPRVTVVISAAPGDNIPWEGGINGCFFRIARDTPVEVPASLAKLIAQRELVKIIADETVAPYKKGRGKRL